MDIVATKEEMLKALEVIVYNDVSENPEIGEQLAQNISFNLSNIIYEDLTLALNRIKADGKR